MPKARAFVNTGMPDCPAPRRPVGAGPMAMGPKSGMRSVWVTRRAHLAPGASIAGLADAALPSTLRWHFYCTPACRARPGACTQSADLKRVGLLSPHEGRKVVLAPHHSMSPEPVSVTLTPRVTPENSVFLPECAREDMGVALLPVYVARKALAQGRLVRVLPGHHSEHNGVRVWTGTLPNRYPTPAAQALIELLQQELPGCIREESGVSL